MKGISELAKMENNLEKLHKHKDIATKEKMGQIFKDYDIKKDDNIDIPVFTKDDIEKVNIEKKIPKEYSVQSHNVENVDKNNYNDANEQKEVESQGPRQNKIDGLRREKEVEKELKKEYSEKDGYTHESEVYLRDKDGNIVKDPETGEARRIDFVVIKDGKVVDSIEVTSKTADKTEQSAKEARIRKSGGNYIKDSNGNLVEIPNDVQTRIERRD